MGKDATRRTKAQEAGRYAHEQDQSGNLRVVGTAGYDAQHCGRGETKIVMWTLAGASETYKKIHEALLPGFGKAFGDVDLELHYIPDYAEKYIVAYAAGTAPDIVTLPTRYQAEYIEKKMVVPIDLAAFNVKSEAELAKMMMPGTMETLRYRDNHIYFMATEISVFGLFCNNDLMGQYGVGSVPTTWEEMLEVGRKFLKTDGDGKTTQIGFGIPGDGSGLRLPGPR
jgi:ABC-type glycerol-3-phosphate transport system substrate-binding protein